MKFSLLLVLSAVIVLAAAQDDEQKAFAEYQAQFGKNYRSEKISETSFQNYRKNKAMVLQNNAAFSRGEVDFELTVNAFSDQDNTEFVRTHTGAVIPASLKRSIEDSSEEHNNTRVARQTVQYRAIDHSLKYPIVHSQKTCGSCYTFSCTLAVEVALAYKTGVNEIISKQQQVDCINTIAAPAGGCQGGWPTNCWDQINKQGGATSAKDYPYINFKSTCKAAPLNSRVKRVSYTRIANSPTAVYTALQSGALACALKATNNLQNYKAGSLSDSLCNGIGGNDINHAVTIVGILPSSTPGQWDWKVQNSWDTTWGDKGFFRMPVGRNMCNLEAFCYSVNVTV